MSSDVIGAILSGGRAKRMHGKRKGLIRHRAGETVIGRLLRQMEEAGLDDQIILANETGPYEAFGRPVVPDLRPGLGPLAGVEAALEYVSNAASAEAVLILPCDVPRITGSEIKCLLDAFRQKPTGVKTAVVRAQETRLHPTCCVVHKSILPAVKKALDEERLRIGHLWRQVGADEVIFHDTTAFFNMNTPQEARMWQEKEDKMATRLLVPKVLKEKVDRFVEDNDLDFEIVTEEPCDMRIVVCEDKQESSIDTLQSGGWIRCATALVIARKLGMSARSIGGLCDLVNVKIKDCSLGCFS